MTNKRYNEQYFEGKTKRGNKNVANILFRNFVLKHTNSRNRLLEIGSAKGEFLKLVEEDFAEVVGIDISQYAINKSKCALKKAKTFLWDIEKGLDAPFIESSFDVIVSMHTFEHFHKPCQVLHNVRSLLLEHGTLFILVPNPKALKLRVAKIFDGKNRFHVLHDPTHYSFHDRNTWTNLIRQAGFNVQFYGRPFYYLKKKFLMPLYGDSYYENKFLHETGPELVFVCRKATTFISSTLSNL